MINKEEGMDKKIIWDLSEEEFKEIEDLFERKLALENLRKIIDYDDEKIYDKFIKDYGKAIRLFEQWWSTMSKKHNWQGENWYVDFETKQVKESA